MHDLNKKMKVKFFTATWIEQTTAKFVKEQPTI